jgi:succinoglycan biosynthesis transport protein ExoP
MRETVDLRNYLSLLWRRKWMVIIPTLVAGLAGFVITMPRIMKPVYRCSATLLVEQPAGLTQDVAGLVSNVSLQERLARLDSQIQSNEFLTKIIANTGMREDAETRAWAERNQKKYPDMSREELIDLKLLRYLRQSIRIRGGTGNQIEVAALDYTPERCYLLVRNLTAAIIEANRSVQMEQFRSTAAFSNTQLLDYKRRLEEAEARLEQFRKSQANLAARPSLIDPTTLVRVQELRRQATSDGERFQREAAAARAAMAGSPVGSGSLDGLLHTPELAGPLAQAKKLEQDYVRQSILEIAQPGMSSQATSIQLARLTSGMRDVLRSALTEAGVTGGAQQAAEDYLIAQARAQLADVRAAEFDGYLGEYSRRATSVPEADLELRRLEQEVASYRTLYTAFEQQVVTTKISEAYESSTAGDRISVIEPPQQPISPIKPKRGPLIVLSIVGGLVLGVLGAFVIEHHDQSLRDVKDTEDRLGVRVIGTIPNIDNLSPQGSRVEPQEREAQAAQRLHEFLDDSPGYQEFRRTALSLLQQEDGGPKSILITSARSGEGKSTASVCLALTLAREIPHERVILVDLDARMPMLAERLGLRIDKPREVASMLRSRVWNDEAVRNGLLPNLALLPMAPVREGAGELINRESIRWLLGELRSRFDRIVIDSPPNLPVPDPLVLGPEVDAVLLVVKAGETPRQTVRRSLELQRSFRDNVWGILMNNVSEALPYYYSYKHYGYGYRKKAR